MSFLGGYALFQQTSFASISFEISDRIVAQTFQLDGFRFSWCVLTLGVGVFRGADGVQQSGEGAHCSAVAGVLDHPDGVPPPHVRA